MEPIRQQRTRIKICGCKTDADVKAAIAAGADALGFVLDADSPRKISPDVAADLICDLPPLIEPVGLFVNTPIDKLTALAEDSMVQTIQLHGTENEKYVEELASEYPIVKAIMFDQTDVRRWCDNPFIDLMLVDGSTGGRGEPFDWAQLAEIRDRLMMPLMLAGGLTPENVGEAIGLLHPFAVDVSSGVEARRGVKDAELITSFCHAVREADRVHNSGPK